jgi:hypothetical protein
MVLRNEIKLQSFRDSRYKCHAILLHPVRVILRFLAVPNLTILTVVRNCEVEDALIRGFEVSIVKYFECL